MQIRYYLTDDATRSTPRPTDVLKMMDVSVTAEYGGHYGIGCVNRHESGYPQDSKLLSAACKMAKAKLMRKL